MSTNIKPFEIAVPEQELENLKDKLSQATFPPEVSFSDDWSYGVPLTDIKRLAAYWKDGYNWRTHEVELNKLPNFTTTVAVDGFEDLEIHFIHQESKREGAMPLLFCHGWPGGFWEAIKILPLLTDAPEGEPCFHVVVPSLPNFGFSQASSKPGFGISQYAETLHKLMQQLGYDKYATQGGDWGFIITRTLGLKYPSHVLASHVNYTLATAPKPLKNPLLYLQSLLPLSSSEKAGAARSKWFFTDGYGYNLLQSSKPHTLSFALCDSPVALLAWIYEKLHDWTDGYAWTDDEVLNWVSLYFFSRAGPAASGRIYYEKHHAKDPMADKAVEWNGNVKMGTSYFPRDLRLPPLTYGRTLGPTVFERVHSNGGHFAAFEVPEVLVGDIRDMFAINGGIGKKWAAKRGK